MDKTQPNEIDMALDDLKKGKTETIYVESFKKQLKD